MASHLSNIFYYKQIEYTDKKGKTKKKKDDAAAPVLYARLIYSDKSKKILSLFRLKGNANVNPFDYLNQYCKAKMALIIESIYLSKNIASLQIKANEVFIKPLKPRKALLTIKENDDDDSEEESEIKTQNKTSFAQLPYYNCKVLTSAHPQFHSLSNGPDKKERTKTQ